jgi:hypothetical protein
MNIQWMDGVLAAGVFAHSGHPHLANCTMMNGWMISDQEIDFSLGCSCLRLTMVV